MVGRKFKFHDGESGAALAIRVKLTKKESGFAKVLRDGTIVVRLERKKKDINENLIGFLSQELKIPKKRFQVIAGENGEHKLISIVDMDPKKVKDYCLKTKEMAAATMNETRDTLYKLRALSRETPENPSIFFDKLCRDFSEATSIATECHPVNFTTMLPERIFKTIYRGRRISN